LIDSVDSSAACQALESRRIQKVFSVSAVLFVEFKSV